MVKSVGKRFLSIALVIVMVLTLLPVIEMSASADSVPTGVDGLTADSSGSATWTQSNGTINGSVKASKSSGCTGDSYSAQSGTLTFTNNSGATALLSFDYLLKLSSGSATVDGTSVTAGTTFSKKLEAGDTVVISITSNGSNETPTTITISNLKLTPEVNVNVTFKAPTNGSCTVDGAAISADTTLTKLTTETFALSAAPASGYKFFGWYSSAANGYFAFSASVTRSFTEDTTVEPRFVPVAVPVFQVGSMLFTDLNEAIGYAQTSGIAKIALISDGTLLAGNYTIPNGKTLVIPFDEAQTVYTTNSEITIGSDGKVASHVTPSAFRTLTMASGANITVASGGVISVPSKVSAVGQNATSWNGTPTGKHGRITMNDGSSIDVQSGGKLYAYGYIAGSGNVYARSGSEIWECFQIRSWRGGSAIGLNWPDAQYKIFPINQYYVQNIEAPVTYYPGATEKVFTAVNMSSQAFTSTTTFVGTGGMFQITSGTVTKQFTGASDRLKLTVNGEFEINPMSLRITGLPLVGTLDLNTADYVLPIQSNITIEVKSGNSTVTQDVAFLPGSELTIDEGATLTLGSRYKTYIYDQDQWGAYAASGLNLVPVGYSTVNGTTAKRTAASLVDAKIDVNGTVIVAGQAYTTEGGAAIVSSNGTGVFKMNAPAGSETNTYQATQSGSDMTKVDIPITPAKLQNADGSYVETADKAAGTEIPYVNGVWGGTPVPTYTVTWVNADGTVLKTDENVEAGTMPKYTGATPTKADDTTAKIHYEFAGWTPELTELTGDVTYTAKYDEQPLYYAVELYYDDAAEPVYTKPETLYKNSLKLTAEDPRNDGKHFSYWTIQYFDLEGNPIGDAVDYNAKQITIHPGVGGITVKARAIYSENETTFGPFVKVIDAKYNPWTNKWSLTLTQSVPSGTATEVGFVVSTDNDNPTVNDTAGVIKVPSAKQLATNTFTAHVSMDGWEGKPLYAQAYLIYGGETIYSDGPALVYPFPTK